MNSVVAPLTWDACPPRHHWIPGQQSTEVLWRTTFDLFLSFVSSFFLEVQKAAVSFHPSEPIPFEGLTDIANECALRKERNFEQQFDMIPPEDDSPFIYFFHFSGTQSGPTLVWRLVAFAPWFQTITAIYWIHSTVSNQFFHLSYLSIRYPCIRPWVHPFFTLHFRLEV